MAQSRQEPNPHHTSCHHSPSITTDREKERNQELAFSEESVSITPLPVTSGYAHLVISGETIEQGRVLERPACTGERLGFAENGGCARPGRDLRGQVVPRSGLSRLVFRLSANIHPRTLAQGTEGPGGSLTAQFRAEAVEKTGSSAAPPSSRSG